MRAFLLTALAITGACMVPAPVMAQPKAGDFAVINSPMTVQEWAVVEKRFAKTPKVNAACKDLKLATGEFGATIDRGPTKDGSEKGASEGYLLLGSSKYLRTVTGLPPYVKGGPLLSCPAH